MTGKRYINTNPPETCNYLIIVIYCLIIYCVRAFRIVLLELLYVGEHRILNRIFCVQHFILYVYIVFKRARLCFDRKMRSVVYYCAGNRENYIVSIWRSIPECTAVLYTKIQRIAYLSNVTLIWWYVGETIRKIKHGRDYDTVPLSFDDRYLLVYTHSVYRDTSNFS